MAVQPLSQTAPAWFFPVPENKRDALNRVPSQAPRRAHTETLSARPRWGALRAMFCVPKFPRFRDRQQPKLRKLGCGYRFSVVVNDPFINGRTLARGVPGGKAESQGNTHEHRLRRNGSNFFAGNLRPTRQSGRIILDGVRVFITNASGWPAAARNVRRMSARIAGSLNPTQTCAGFGCDNKRNGPPTSPPSSPGRPSARPTPRAGLA